jgi:starch synthase (maltosyl-transferring)
VRKTDPDVLFLAEAFTKPAMMHMLGKVGYHQGYTYFTWRNEKWELEEYLTELSGETAHFLRPNFFVNTPDILHAFLQYGGPPAFKIRATLAATLTPTWGVYAGFELFEHVAVRPGSEEYLDTEKFQLRPRDWAAAEAEGRSLAPYLTRLNELRRAHPALQRLRNLRFHATDSDQIICYSKSTTGADGRTSDTVLVVVNLDPHGARETTVRLDMPALGMEWDDTMAVHDEIAGDTYVWGQANYVRLDPFHEPAHVFRVERRGRADEVATP